MLRKANTDYAEKNTNLHNEVEELKTRWNDFIITMQINDIHHVQLSICIIEYNVLALFSRESISE